MIRVAVVTLSDTCAAGLRTDVSGPLIEEMLPPDVFQVCHRKVLPDDLELIAAELRILADQALADLVLTTGGTGLGPRDVTPEATSQVCDRMIPGLAEWMRSEGLKKTPNAVLSRATAGLRRNTLIINLPGSARAVRECMETILAVLPHAVEMIYGGGHEHKEA